MRRDTQRGGFTIIELLTVIAIIAVLTAILFPVASTVREQARATDCQTKLHQIWVSTRVYMDDEGGAPPALFAYAEMEINDPLNPGNKIRVPWQPGGPNAIPVNKVTGGFLYPEMVKDSNVFKCPDNLVVDKAAVTVAYFPPTAPPGNWTNPRTSTQYGWMGNFLAARGCPVDANGVVDCFWDVNPADPLLGYLYLQPKYYYIWDSYDVGPRVADNGTPVLDTGGLPIFDRHYSADWTGVTGINDLTAQLKYKAPPNDRTLLTYCTHHAYAAKVDSVTTVAMSGVAKKVKAQVLNKFGANYLNALP